MTLWWDFDCSSIFIVAKIIGHFLQIISSTQWSWWSMRNQSEKNTHNTQVPLIYNDQISQSFTSESSSSQSTKCVFVLHHLFARSSSCVVVWTIPKASREHERYHKTIYPHSTGEVQARGSASSPGEGFGLSLDQVTQTASGGTVWKRRGEKNSIPATDSDWWGECTHSLAWLETLRSCDPFLFSTIWSSTLMNCRQFISGSDWNFLSNWDWSKGKGMGGLISVV